MRGFHYSKANSFKRIYLALPILVVMASAYWLIHDVDLLIDEKWHYFQIFLFSVGKVTPLKGISVLPGYHYLMAGLAYLTGLRAPEFFRACSFAISLVTIFVFFRLSQVLSAGRGYRKTWQFVFLPILFPFFFLIYTDVLSLLLVLLSLYLVGNRRFWLAGAVGVAAMLIRQNNIVWLVLLFLLVLLENHPIRFDRIRMLTLLKNTWVFIAGLALFILYFIANHGAALGDRAVHPAFIFHSGNLVFFLILIGILFLPDHISNFNKIAVLASNHRVSVLVSFILLFALYWFTFTVDHPYNQPDFAFFLRNQVVNFISATAATKAVLFLPIYYVLLSLAVTPLAKPAYYSIYPLIAFYLSASWLIEPRYCIIPCTLFLLLRKERDHWVGLVTTLYLSVLTAFVFLGTRNQQFFL